MMIFLSKNFWIFFYAIFIRCYDIAFASLSLSFQEFEENALQLNCCEGNKKIVKWMEILRVLFPSRRTKSDFIKNRMWLIASKIAIEMSIEHVAWLADKHLISIWMNWIRHWHSTLFTKFIEKFNMTVSRSQMRKMACDSFASVLYLLEFSEEIMTLSKLSSLTFGRLCSRCTVSIDFVW